MPDSAGSAVMQVVTDSPVTYKAVGLAFVANGYAQYHELASGMVTLLGGVVIVVAGVYLIVRHASQSRLNNLQAIKIKLEIEDIHAERLKAKVGD